MSMVHLHRCTLMFQATKADLQNSDLRQQLINAVKGTLHTSQPWYHGNISRDEAERAFNRSGHADGKYL